MCAAQYGPRPTIGLPQRVNGRFSPSGHWQPRGIGGGGGAATAGGGFSGGGRRGGMPHYVAVTPSGCHTGRAEVSDVMQECSTPAARRSVTSPPSRCGCCRTSSSGSADGSAACRPRPLSISFCRSAGAWCWQPPLHHTSTSIEVAGAQRRAGRRQAVVVERLADPIAPRALCRSSTPFGAGSTASNRRRFFIRLP